MRVCLLHDTFYRSSGSAIVIRRIAEAFGNENIRFYFAGCQQDNQSTDSQAQDLVWMSSRYQHFDLMRSGPKLLSECVRFSQWLKSFHCDLVHVHHRRLACIANLLSGVTQIPVLFTAHNTFPWSFLFWATAPSTVTGVSQSVVEYLKRSTRARQVFLTENPFPFPTQMPDDRPPAKRVISVGRLEPVKGHTHLINAWKIIRQQGSEAKLDIYGEGSLYSDLSSRIYSENLENSITLRGFNPDISRELRDASFNVLVSSTEGFPNIVIEAAALRIPSLITNVDGSRDCLPPGLSLPNGVEFGNVKQLASALGTWIASPNLVKQDGCSFYQHLRERCSVEHVRKRYHAIYNGLVAKSQERLAVASGEGPCDTHSLLP